MTAVVPNQPVIALAIGDPAGVGPELAAMLLADPDVRAAASLVVFGDRRVLARGAADSAVTFDIDVRGPGEDIVPGAKPVLIDLGHLDPATIVRGVAAAGGGRFALANFSACLKLAAAGKAQAVCFTPFNKAAMRLAHPSYDDEVGYTQEVLGIKCVAKEFNVLDGLWNARVTSHVPLSAVAGLITTPDVLDNIRLTNASLLEAGLAVPRIGVAALNPHAGDGGNFGHEEETIIAPAVAQARQEGIEVQGPFPSDTVFVRATRGAFDAVLTMYHDQGQIAMKLIGFDRGVTLLGGFPFPICTPAHGSAYDIAGKGIANPGASKAAVLLAAKMAGRQRHS
ncbi:MAG: 4-hydroxythreonine-4-phosphate dehydrogenase PdxA [Acetobacteraceae bacterium]|nr:4-hydroxythreonine-4-phosphate dehydrogenase PdxA [Acetobacteraceae bacterium]